MSETATENKTSLSGRYQLDPSHTRLGFVARHAMIAKVRGEFSQFEGTLDVNAENPSASSAQVQIQVGSVTTGDESRDAHLLGEDFFDAENHPEMTFVSTSAEQTGDDTFRLTGDLTIRGVTNSVTVELTYGGSATDPFGYERIGFEGTTVVNRKDWGLTWNAPLETGGILVGDKVTLEFDISAVRADS